jgi:hypothetical protein
MDVEFSVYRQGAPWNSERAVGIKHKASAVAVASRGMSASRSHAPVFVLGSVRSGTTLLYHMLLSSGGFAVYRTESHAINLLEPRFGDLSKLRNRKRLMQAWLNSKLFQVSGLDAAVIEKKVLEECSNGGNFLRVVMEEIARRQGVERWADCTPEHLAYLHRIKETIPDALIIHIIRDGRDVALSLEKQRWIRPFPWDRKRPLLAGAAYWDWIVHKGRKDGRSLGKDYCEVRFEELIGNPREVLGQLSGFIEHDLDYDRIRENGIGSVNQPNTSFAKADTEFNPVGRWRGSILPRELILLEGMIGDTLEELGYELATPDLRTAKPMALERLRANYRKYFDFKLWLKSRTPAGRFLVTRDLSWL